MIRGLIFPASARGFIDLEPYRNAGIEKQRLLYTNIVSSRGCPYRLTGAAKPISGDKFSGAIQR